MAKEQDEAAIDFARLVNLETETPQAETTTPEPEPKPEKEAAKEPEKTPEPEPKKEPEEQPPSKALTKLQQRQTTLERQQAEQIGELNKKLERLLERQDKQSKALGIEEETPQPEAVRSNPDLAELHDTQRRAVALEREIQFLKIQRKHPDADPEAMLKDAITEALELHDIDPDEPLPDGFNKAAIDKVAAKLFQRKVEALGKKKPAPAAKEEPLRPLPEKTRTGSKVSATPASHIPSSGKTPEREGVKEEYLRLTGQLTDD